MNDYAKILLAQQLNKEYEEFNRCIQDISGLKEQINNLAEEAKFRLEKSASLAKSLGFEKNEPVKIGKLEAKSGPYCQSISSFEFVATEEFEKQLVKVLDFKEK